jgi:hypothetical protein
MPRMIPTHLLSRYREWKTDATGEFLTLPQFVAVLLTNDGPATDLIVALTTLASPTIVRRDAYVLVDELFAPARLQQMQQDNVPNDEIEYWINLFLVSQTFDQLSDEQCEYVARSLHRLWTLNLRTMQFDDYGCRLIDDEDDGWALTICRNSTFPNSGQRLTAS